MVLMRDFAEGGLPYEALYVLFTEGFCKTGLLTAVAGFGAGLDVLGRDCFVVGCVGCLT